MSFSVFYITTTHSSLTYCCSNYFRDSNILLKTCVQSWSVAFALPFRVNINVNTTVLITVLVYPTIAPLTPLAKADVTSGPIAVGNTSKRLISTFFMSKSSANVGMRNQKDLGIKNCTWCPKNGKRNWEGYHTLRYYQQILWINRIFPVGLHWLRRFKSFFKSFCAK